MARRMGWLFIILFVLGAGGAFAGWKLALPLLVYLGILVAGLGILAGGVETLIVGWAGFSSGEYGQNNETYSGLAVTSWGCFFVLLGLTVGLGGLVLILGGGDAVLAYLKQRPGAALVLAGLLLLSFGFPELLGSHQARGSLGGCVSSLPTRVFGLLLILLGLAALVLGLVEGTMPATFDSWFEHVVRSLTRPPA